MGSYVTDLLKKGGSGAPPETGDGRFGGGGGGRGASRRASITGLVVALAAVVMFFAAFTSAMVVRRGLSNDWVSMPLPGVVWFSSAVLLASSVALEIARRALKAGERDRFNRFWVLATLLGVVFLGGQYFAWMQLQSAGVYISTNPSSSFFYLLTVAHACHLAGGLVALFYVTVQALRLQLGPGKRTAVEVTSLYWHFMDGLWIYLMVLFLFWG